MVSYSGPDDQWVKAGNFGFMLDSGSSGSFHYTVSREGTTIFTGNDQGNLHSRGDIRAEWKDKNLPSGKEKKSIKICGLSKKQ